MNSQTRLIEATAYCSNAFVIKKKNFPQKFPERGTLMKQFSLLFVSIVLGLAIESYAIANDLCCYCLTADRHEFDVKNPGGIGECSIACNANQGTATGGRICRFGQRSPSPEVIEAGTYWSIWHQGAEVWDGPDGNTLKSGAALKEVIVGAFGGPAGHESDYATMVAASVEQIEAAVKKAVERCPSEHPVTEGISWVCNNQGDRRLYNLAQGEDFRQLRVLYHWHQSHNDNAKNTLSCYSGKQLTEITEAVCK